MVESGTAISVKEFDVAVCFGIQSAPYAFYHRD